MGFSVNALIALMIAVAAITSANWRNICPVIPGRNEAGRNTDGQHQGDAEHRAGQFLIALIAASLGVSPCSI